MGTSTSMRIALAAWEMGRIATGLGAKIGGLGVIVEELPAELKKAAARKNIELEVVVLSPCFAYYDRSRLTPLDMDLPVTLDGRNFSFQAFEYTFLDGQRVVYFWDEGQLHWTIPQAVYPDDPILAYRLYATVSQAMAGYIQQESFHTVHLHDYHVGLIPFYIKEEILARLPVHFTVHNASYQGLTPLEESGPAALNRIGLDGEKLFSPYFQFGNHLNLMKACMLKVHETGGRITTVSGDVAGNWGYAAELMSDYDTLWRRAYAQKGGPPGEIFLPNQGLDVFEKLPVCGITNGMGGRNRPENLPELQAEVLRGMQHRQGTNRPLFRHPIPQAEMLSRDHTYDAKRLAIKRELKRLLHLEAFDVEPGDDAILLCAVGRLVAQKNLGLVAEVAETVLAGDPDTHFVLLASAPQGDPEGKSTESAFARLAMARPDRVYFNPAFNPALSKLILAGGDFVLIPSRFEPCGLVDYEASLLGTIVVGKATGGLTKVAHCAYLYDWLDISDRAGEIRAFRDQIRQAIRTYRLAPARHEALMRTAMGIDAAWDHAAAQYVDLYRYGRWMKQWKVARRRIQAEFIRSLGSGAEVFDTFFEPAGGEYNDTFDRELKARISAAQKKHPLISLGVSAKNN